MKKQITKWVALMGLAVVVGLTGCEDPVYPDPVPATGESTNLASVRFVHAAPGVGPLDFFANNVQVGTTQSFLGATPYTTLNVGPTQFRGRGAAGSAIGGTLEGNDVLFRLGATNQTNFTLRTRFGYTVIVGDLASRPVPTAPRGVTDPGGIRFIVLEDNLTAPAGNNAGVRFVHLAPGAPAVWVTTASGTVFAGASNRAFALAVPVAGNTSGSRTLLGGASAFATVPAAGSVNIQIRTGSATGTVVAALGGITLEAGRLYTIYARGVLGGTGDNALGASIIQHN